MSHLRRPEQTTLLIIWGLSEVITVLIQRLEPPDTATPVLLRTCALLKRYLRARVWEPVSRWRSLKQRVLGWARREQVCPWRRRPEAARARAPHTANGAALGVTLCF